MNRVFVLDRLKNPLMPCHPARARQLLDKKRAKIFLMYPFTIILQDREGGDLQNSELKFDPGSKTTGISIVALFKRGFTVVWAAHLEHRALAIKEGLQKRAGVRRGRRSRNCRHREPRFLNRTRHKGWVPPSLYSRVNNAEVWARRLISLTPITSIPVETVRFDMQKMVNPEISGVQYQQGELVGYDVREYLLEKFHHECVYCGKGNVPLEVEHVIARANHGSNKVSNLAISCRPCNEKKGTQRVEDFVKDKVKLEKLLKQLKAPLRDAAAVNVTRYLIGEKLKKFGLSVSFWSGSRTKMNRIKQDYDKDHFIDAACVGETGACVYIPKTMKPLIITAKGRGNRQMCLVDKYGFPRTKAKTVKQVDGFMTGDIVRLNQPSGKYKGVWFGCVSVRANKNFDITVKVDGKSKRISAASSNFTRLHGFDGYTYA